MYSFVAKSVVDFERFYQISNFYFHRILVMPGLQINVTQDKLTTYADAAVPVTCVTTTRNHASLPSTATSKL